MKLPIGQHGRFPAPKQGATDLPLSKVTGNPNRTLWASLPTTASPRAIAAKKPWRDRPEPTMSAAGRGRILPGTAMRDAARLKAELADKKARFKSAPVPLLGASKQTGMDWIKYGRRLNPAVPGGVNGLVQPTRPPALRGSSADAARVPAGTLAKMAAKAQLATGGHPQLTNMVRWKRGKRTR